MADPRVPRFELHIQPMMRLLDREHMLPFGFDLWSYEDTKTHAADIIGVVKDGFMPPVSHGGPWPQEWIDLFVRWKETGFQRLQLGTASTGITAAKSGAAVTLVAKGRVPSPGFTVWLDLEHVSPAERRYRLVQEPPIAPAPGPERPFTARERFETDDPTLVLRVTDAIGTHTVPIASPEALDAFRRRVPLSRPR
jgi:hypothetical protein